MVQAKLRYASYFGLKVSCAHRWTFDDHRRLGLMLPLSALELAVLVQQNPPCVYMCEGFDKASML